MTKTFLSSRFLSMMSAISMALCSATSSGVELLIRDVQPTEGLIASYSDGNETGSQATFAFRPNVDNTFTTGANGTVGKGQTFLLEDTTPDTLYEISAISLVIAANSVIAANGTLQVEVFDMNTSDPEVPETGGWLGGNGRYGVFATEPTPAPDYEVLDGTGYSSLFSDTIDLSSFEGDLTAGSVFSLEFDPGELTLSDGGAYGFFVQYQLPVETLNTLVADVAGDTGIRFVTAQTDGGGTGVAGDLINTGFNTNTVLPTQASSSTRDLRFFVRVAVPGDYDGDGTIGLGDYELWRSTYGSETELDADGNGDGKVDGADYALWRNLYVAPEPEPMEGIAVATPEPTCLSLFALVLPAFFSARRRG